MSRSTYAMLNPNRDRRLGGGPGKETRFDTVSWRIPTLAKPCVHPTMRPFFLSAAAEKSAVSKMTGRTTSRCAPPRTAFSCTL